MRDLTRGPSTVAERARALVLERGLSFVTLGSEVHRTALTHEPLGIPSAHLAAEEHPDLVDLYYRANRAAFSGPLQLPGWVLNDLYLMPGAMGLLMGPRALLPSMPWKGGDGTDRSLLAAYFAAPTLTPRHFVGVSLFSLLPGAGFGVTVKALTLASIRAEALRGIVQWGSPSLRAHVQMGPTRFVGPAPGPHEQKSFVYETDVALGEPLKNAEPDTRVQTNEPLAVEALLSRHRAGEAFDIVSPGLTESGEMLLRTRISPP